MNPDRRLQERKLPEQIVLCKLGDQESSSVLNLSEDGLCFESLTPIEETDLLSLRLSAELNSPIEATGRLAWIDPAKRTGGLRFLELSAPAREQIRAWLSVASAVSSAGTEDAFLQNWDKLADDRLADDRAVPDSPSPDQLETEKRVVWQETRVPSTQLVPIERHQARTRSHFLFGTLIGFGIGTALITLTFWYASRTKPGSVPRATATASRQAQSSAQQTQAPVVPPVSPGALISKSAPTKPLATVSPAAQTASAAAPSRSPQSQSQNQSPPSAEASSTVLTGTPPPSATPQPTKPGERVANSLPTTKSEPLASSQAAVAAAPDASTADSSSVPKERQVEGPVERPVEGSAEGKAQHPKREKVPPTPEQLWAALQKGNMKAAVALADLYLRGESVPMNCQQARVLLQIASEKHNAEASKRLQELDKDGCPPTTPASEPQP